MANNAVSYWFSSPTPHFLFQSYQLCQGHSIPLSSLQLLLFHVSILVYRYLKCLNHKPFSYPSQQPTNWLSLPHTQLCSETSCTLCWEAVPCPPGETDTQFVPALPFGTFAFTKRYHYALNSVFFQGPKYPSILASRMTAPSTLVSSRTYLSTQQATHHKGPPSHRQQSLYFPKPNSLPS